MYLQYTSVINTAIVIICLGGESNDQATAESYWTPGHVQSAQEDDSAYVQPEEYFPSAHGLVQTHPATFSGFGSEWSKKITYIL